MAAKPESLAGDVVALLQDLRARGHVNLPGQLTGDSAVTKQRLLDAAEVITHLLEHPTPAISVDGGVEIVAGEGTMQIGAWAISAARFGGPPGEPGLLMDFDVIGDRWDGMRRIRLIAAGPSAAGVEAGVVRSMEMLRG